MYKDCSEALHTVRTTCSHAHDSKCAEALNVHTHPDRIDDNDHVVKCLVSGFSQPFYTHVRDPVQEEQVVLGMPLSGGLPSRVVP